MKIKKYVADDMAQACELIRGDLGSDALILSTQQLKPSPFSLKRKPQIEVVAGLAEDGDRGDGSRVTERAAPALEQSAFAHELVRHTAETAAAAATATISPAALARSASESYALPVRAGRPTAPRTRRPEPSAAPGSTGPAEGVSIERLERQLTELREAIERMNRPKGPSHLLSLSEPVRQLHQRLVEQEVPGDLCDLLVADLRQSIRSTGLDNEPAIFAAAAEALTSRLREARALQVTPGRTTVAFFIGPTGSGKTTTAVKLAARLSREGRAVLLVNTDVNRAGAVQQFEAYASALGIPSETVYTPGDLRALVSRTPEYEAIVIDTTGASPENTARLEEIRALLATIRRKDVYLTLSATSKLSDLRRARERFELSPLAGLALTRRDETATLGPAVALLAQCNLPLAFIGHGQNVLSDLLPADIRELADATLGRERHDEEVSPAAFALGA